MTGPKQFKPWIFPFGVGLVYLAVWIMAPEMIKPAFKTMQKIVLRMVLPLTFAFLMMFLLNHFIRPAHITRFMNRQKGVRTMLMSSAAGIISMGPIFTWYPFLKTLKQKGVPSLYLANFLSSRAVKPVLLPVLITCFGWRFCLIFTLMTLVNAWAVSGIVTVFSRPDPLE